MKEWDNRCAAQREGYMDTLDIAGFEEFLRDLHVDPPNWQRIAALKYNGALQRKGQSICKFVAYLKDLEWEMEPYTKLQRTTHLLTKIHPEMRQQLLKGVRMPLPSVTESIGVGQVMVTWGELGQVSRVGPVSGT
ncbi:hypothetical protein GMDG_07834 [Pseudogymnoascus destructans 20631-21]|uniref:Uncharacterized protein n=1 Tax=Pseudogymnoascus destructans (strain ATCC MYA-4855 / 20631-21) TaxID=658429 RepID=L8G089_PSED2|nr:hypothetical protein GMDG_07834 [Pseudogymnoascus destructans 20631-21]